MRRHPSSGVTSGLSLLCCLILPCTASRGAVGPTWQHQMQTPSCPQGSVKHGTAVEPICQHSGAALGSSLSCCCHMVVTALQQHVGQQGQRPKLEGTLRHLTQVQHPAMLLLVYRAPDR